MVSARVIAFAAAIPLVACGLSKPITQEEAARTIRESEAFQRPKFVRLPRQITFQGYRTWSRYGQERLFSVNELAQVDPVVAILKIQRVIRVDENIYGGGEERAMHLFVITPTDLDSASLLPDVESSSTSTDPQAIEDARDRRPYGRQSYGMNEVKREREWKIPIGVREFVQVDEIHNWRDANLNIPVNELAVDFSWRWLPNDLGEAFDSRSSSFESLPDSVQEAARSSGVRLNTSEPMHSRAFLTRDKDGIWKLRVIEWSFGRGNPD